MELRQLRYFAEVASTGTFSAAAERLNVAQPALWQQVKVLERELGSPLFERVGRRVRLTRHGRVLLEKVEQVLDSAELLRRLAKELSAGRSGLVVVACSPPHISRFVGEVVGRFRALHPDVAVELREHPPLPALPMGDLGTGGADLAVGTHTPDCDGFPVYRVNLVAAVPPGHRWAGRATLPIRRLEGERLLVTSHPNLSRILLERACTAAGVEPAFEVESPSPTTLIALGLSGLGIPLLADDALATVEEDQAPVLVGDDGPVGAEVWLHWRRELRMTPALEAFIAEARAVAAAMSPRARAGGGTRRSPRGRARPGRARTRAPRASRSTSSPRRGPR